MASEKWTQKELECAADEVFNGSQWSSNDVGEIILGNIATELACQRNALRDALTELMAWHGPGTAEEEGAKCGTWNEAEELCRAALEKSK
jgi:hypothetical protein